MKTRTILISLAAAGTLAGAAYWLMPRPPATPVALLQPDNTRLTALGATIYQAQCVACHGAQLEGQPNWRERGPDGLLPAPPHDASGHTWHHPDAVLFRITRNGVAQEINDPSYRTAMPAFAGVLSDAEIVAVLSWIKAQWPTEIRERHDKINAQHAAAAAS